MTAITINLDSVIRLTDDQFYELCRNNEDVQFELTSEGHLIVMPPTGWKTGSRNADLIYQVQAWNRQQNLGFTFDSSTGFALPNGAKRSPDVSWVRKERIEDLQPDPAKFLPFAPDFVIELRSATDSFQPLQQKMQEYIQNGTRLGWLIDPQQSLVEIYRPEQEVEVLQAPVSLSGEEILPGFTLDLLSFFES